MNQDDREIDILLRRSVDRQLDSFDWEGLRRDIGSRLARAPVSAPARSVYGKWAARAAVLAVAAGVLVLAMISSPRPEPARSTVGEAKVAMIETTRAAGVARVSLLPVAQPGQCAVRVLTSDKPRPEGGARASWCIVVGQGSLREQHAGGRDVSDVMCLF